MAMFRRITQFMRYDTKQGPGNLKFANHVVLAKPQDFEAVTSTSEKTRDHPQSGSSKDKHMDSKHTSTA
jgi:hypothetical protein